MEKFRSVMLPGGAIAFSALFLGFILIWLRVASQPLLSSNSTKPSPLTVQELAPVLPSPPPLSSIKDETSPNPVLKQPGALRVSNLTIHPIRVILRQNAASDPIHWDFAPGEGGSRGLILSPPVGNLQLNEGDILFAFAQDGSLIYWGPFIVGETSLPVLESKTLEWQLIVSP